MKAIFIIAVLGSFILAGAAVLPANNASWYPDVFHNTLPTTTETTCRKAHWILGPPPYDAKTRGLSIEVAEFVECPPGSAVPGSNRCVRVTQREHGKQDITSVHDDIAGARARVVELTDEMWANATQPE